MAEQGELVTGARGLFVKVGLGRPEARAFVAASLVGVAAYIARMPPQSFTDEGEMRPFKALSKSPEASYAHFLLLPVTVGTAVFLFT